VEERGGIIPLRRSEFKQTMKDGYPGQQMGGAASLQGEAWGGPELSGKNGFGGRRGQDRQKKGHVRRTGTKGSELRSEKACSRLKRVPGRKSFLDLSKEQLLQKERSKSFYKTQLGGGKAVGDERRLKSGRGKGGRYRTITTQNIINS